MERTLIVLKPDAMQRGIIGDIITRFEHVGLKIVAAKIVKPSEDHYYHHYETIGKLKTRISKEVLDVTIAYMQEGPVLAVVLEGVEAVSLVRKMIGATEPKSAVPGTIRGDYSHISYEYANSRGVSIPNLVHASSDPKEAKLEISHWFNDEEIFDYPSVHDRFTLVN